MDRDLAIAEARLGAGDLRGAREAFRALLEIESDNTRARLGIAACDVREGELDSAIARYQALATDPRLSVLERASALEARADVQVMANQPALALDGYAQVRKVDADEDRQRTLEVKGLAAVAPPEAGLRKLLIGDPERGPSWDEAAPALGAEAAEGDPLSQYLLGRNLWNHGRPEAALGYLSAALDPLRDRVGFTWPPSLSVLREALRLRVIITCSDPRLPRTTLAADAQRLQNDPGLTAAKREAFVRFARRCGALPPVPPAP